MEAQANQGEYWLTQRLAEVVTRCGQRAAAQMFLHSSQWAQSHYAPVEDKRIVPVT